MSQPYSGRLKPYVGRGILRIPCTRCGAPSFYQWSLCANGNRHSGLCAECDVALNEMALEFMRIPNRDVLMAAYRERVLA